MNEQEIQEVLDELHKVRPEKLNDKGKRLFNAIMSIADERDLYKQRIDKAIKLLEEYLDREYVITDEYFEHIIQILKDDYEYVFVGSDKEWVKIK